MMSSTISSMLWFAVIAGVVGIAYGLFLASTIFKKSSGSEKMQAIFIIMKFWLIDDSSV